MQLNSTIHNKSLCIWNQLKSATPRKAVRRNNKQDADMANNYIYVQHKPQLCFSWPTTDNEKLS